MEKVIDLVLYIFKTLKFENFKAQISLRDPDDPKKYTVTHRYLGTNPFVQSFKYKEKVSPTRREVVGGTYNAEKNMNEISSKINPSYLDRAKSYFGSWWK